MAFLLDKKRSSSLTRRKSGKAHGMPNYSYNDLTVTVYKSPSSSYCSASEIVNSKNRKHVIVRPCSRCGTVLVQSMISFASEYLFI
ncbi:hypothetical protein RRG08_060910 [Elysia crispata]|uniref:Uncharacterized protein n=1 Tax=Elysia crispata TaxID=231223 RepID=A0AAE1D959_9GAST|nr:hypothetical protein RRG08_060910 [Elysia crispata]